MEIVFSQENTRVLLAGSKKMVSVQEHPKAKNEKNTILCGALTLARYPSANQLPDQPSSDLQSQEARSNVRLHIPRKYSVLLFCGGLSAIVGASLSLGSTKWASGFLSPGGNGGIIDVVGTQFDTESSQAARFLTPIRTLLGILSSSPRSGQRELRALAIAAAISMLVVVGVVNTARFYRLQKFAARQSLDIERREKLAKSLLNLIADPVIFVNASGVVEAYNSAIEDLFGYAERELLGSLFTVLLSDPERHLSDLKRNVVFAATGSNAGGKLARVVVRHKKGRTFPVEVNVGRAEIDGVVVYAGTVREISDVEETHPDRDRADADYDSKSNPESKTGVVSEDRGAARSLSIGTDTLTETVPPGHAKARRIDPPGPIGPRANANSSGYRVLLAEDHPINQHLTSKRLRELGCMVDVVETGTQAVDAVRIGAYDLVLMDVRMPDMNGIEAIRKIRAIEGSKIDPPIIVVTADSSSSTRAECLSAGANGLLSKPVQRDKFLETLSGYLDITIDSRICGSVGDGAGDFFDSDLVRFEYQTKTKRKPLEGLSELIDDIETLEQTIV